MKQKHLSYWGIGPVFVAVSIILSVIGFLLHCLSYPRFSIEHIPYPVVIVISTMLVVVGGYLWGGSAFIIRKSIDADTLVQTGVYAIVRNPIYSGILFVLSGILILGRSYLLLPIPVILYIFLRILVKKEEKDLLEHFGREYQSYKSRVNAIIPTIRKYK